MSPALAQALHVLRQKAGLTQPELARRVGIDPSYISRVESGHRDIMSDKLERWIEVCGGQIELVSGDERTPIQPPSQQERPVIPVPLLPDDLALVLRFAQVLGQVPEDAKLSAVFFLEGLLARIERDG